MQSAVEQAYSAVERLYGEGNFAEALQQAASLQPALESGRPDLLDQRLQLLIGHILLYGLGQVDQAAEAYSTVLERCSEPSYRALAEQSLQLCNQQPPPQPQPQPEPEPEPKPELELELQTAPEPAPANPDSLPATPWLQQLQDPQQALAEIQQAWSTVVPATAPVAVPAPEPGEAAAPWLELPDQDTAAPAASEPEQAVEQSVEQEAEHAPEAPAPPAAAEAPDLNQEADRAAWQQGLLLVRLSAGGERAPAPAAEQLQPGRAAAPPPVHEHQAEARSVVITAPSLGGAWSLFKRHWRTYLALEAAALTMAGLAAGLQGMSAGLQNLNASNPVLALLAAVLLLGLVIGINLWSNLLNVSLQVAPALALRDGQHPSAAAVIHLLRRNFWRYVRAGVVVGAATLIGLLLLIVPGLLVMIATPVVVRRVFCNDEPALAAVLTAVKEVSEGPTGSGLLKWELVASLLMLASVLLCGVPLLVTIPLGNILIQQYLAHSGLGSSRR